MEELDTNVKTSVDKIQIELENVKAEIYKTNNDTSKNNRLFEELKTEISSVKGLLLNRYNNLTIFLQVLTTTEFSSF